MEWSLSLNDLSTLLMVLFTLITTVANILLWNATRKTVQLLLEQVHHQIASSRSQAQSRIIDGHRELFLGILNNPSLLESFTAANDLDPKAWEIQKITQFLINQVQVVYLNFINKIISPTHFDSFKRDARDVFAYKSVRQHWEQVRVFHAEDFRRFVETELLYAKVESA